jgi:hypothetical protein
MNYDLIAKCLTAMTICVAIDVICVIAIIVAVLLR